jgi:hypothetical protein
MKKQTSKKITIQPETKYEKPKGFLVWFKRKKGFLTPIPFKWKLPDIEPIRKYAEAQMVEGISDYIINYLEIENIEVTDEWIILQRNLHFSNVEQVWMENAFRNRKYEIQGNKILVYQKRTNGNG